MPYFCFLSVIMVVLAALCSILWKRTHSLGFLLGIAFIYFWTLHGAWSIITDLSGGDSQKYYHYLYEKMFAVYLDQNYAWALGIYAGFMIVTILAILYWIRPAQLPSENLDPIIISHDRLILLCGLAAFASFWMMRKQLGGALAAGKSGYAVTRFETTDLGMFHIHQVLNRVALVPAAIGLATFLTSGSCRFLTGVRRMRHLTGYAGLLAFMFCFCVVLGNKNELAYALFSACLFYIANSTRPKTVQLVTSGAVLLALVGFIDYARGFTIDQITSNVSLGEIAYSLIRLADSNEAFAAHMSMYGVLAFDLPLTYGSSATAFLASAVPYFLWPDRPPSIYWHYADGISAVEGQGYTIHHAAGWYLNFGIPGVVLGACLLGWIWATLYNNVSRGALQPTNTWWRMFCIIGFFTFSANIPSLVRAGPEIYKGMIVDSFLVPIGVLLLTRSGSTASMRQGIRQFPLPARGRNPTFGHVNRKQESAHGRPNAA